MHGSLLGWYLMGRPLIKLGDVFEFLPRFEFYSLPALDPDLLVSPDISSITCLFFDHFKAGESPYLDFLPFFQGFLYMIQYRVNNKQGIASAKSSIFFNFLNDILFNH